MAIEFRCDQCGKLLRTPDDSAGKQAKCPACSMVLTIPAAGQQPGPLAPPLPLSGPLPAVPSDNPYAPPQSATYESATPAAVGEIVPTPIEPMEVLRRSWAILKSNFGICLGAIVVGGVINFVAQFASEVLVGIIVDAGNDAATLFGWLIGTCFNTAVNTWIGAGQLNLMLKVARGERPEFNEMFVGGRWFWKVLGAGILFGLMFLAGLVLLIVPGIILALMFGQYYFLIIDRDVGVVQAFELSRTIMAGNKASLFIIWLLSFLLVILGAIPCLLGWIVVFPYIYMTWPVFYLMATGQRTASA